MSFFGTYYHFGRAYGRAKIMQILNWKPLKLKPTFIQCLKETFPSHLFKLKKLTYPLTLKHQDKFGSTRQRDLCFCRQNFGGRKGGGGKKRGAQTNRLVTRIGLDNGGFFLSLPCLGNADVCFL